MKILVTGGCGYKGSKLIPQLLADGHKVTSLDTKWFGDFLPSHSNLLNLTGDIRDIDEELLVGVESIVHLANIANDPAVELNASLSWEVNVLASHQLADKAMRAGVKQIIFASSGSVYGIKEEERVTEDLTLCPISVYNKTKMVAERVFLSYKDSMQIHCIRPATVCGISPRMRLDVSVNMLTYQALDSGSVTVYGGSQTRPNIHIDDAISVYTHFIENPNIESGCYNAGFENLSILEIAELVKEYAPCDVIITPSNDPRSYRQDSSKLLATGFTPKYTVRDAIEEIVADYKLGKLQADERWFTIKRMNSLGLGE